MTSPSEYTSEVSLKGSQSYAFRHEAMGQIIGALKSMKGILSTVILHKEVMQQSVGRLFSQGTDLTDALGAGKRACPSEKGIGWWALSFGALWTRVRTRTT
jgi:argininosuccinate lyase